MTSYSVSFHFEGEEQVHRAADEAFIDAVINAMDAQRGVISYTQPNGLRVLISIRHVRDLTIREYTSDHD